MRFHFVAEGTTAKNTAIRVKTLQVIGSEDIFSFPMSLQAPENHTQLFTLPIVKTATKNLLRNQYRNLIVTLPEEIAAIYFDEEGNARVGEHYLDELSDTSSIQSSSPIVAENKKSMQSITKDMVCEKFSGKNVNAETWLKLFTQECNRLHIELDQ